MFFFAYNKPNMLNLIKTCFKFLPSKFILHHPWWQGEGKNSTTFLVAQSHRVLLLKMNSTRQMNIPRTKKNKKSVKLSKCLLKATFGPLIQKLCSVEILSGINLCRKVVAIFFSVDRPTFLRQRSNIIQRNKGKNFL